MKQLIQQFTILSSLCLIACGGGKSTSTYMPSVTDLETVVPSVTKEPTRSEIKRDSGATVTINDFGAVQIHTFMAPWDKFANASHVVVTANSVVIVDPNMTIDQASDLRAYVDGLGKPIERLIVSHAHPDHYFGLAVAFEDVPSYALATIVDEISKTGEDTRKAREGMFPPGWVVDHITPPNNILTPGEFTVDGLTWIATSVDAAEAGHQVRLDIPSLRVAITQDLVYTGSHPVITNGAAIDSWISHLDAVATSAPVLVLGGHGPPTDIAGVQFMKTYLTTAKGLLAPGSTAQSFMEGMKTAYPKLGGDGFLKFSVFFLFPSDQKH